MQFCSEFLISVEGALPGDVDGDVRDGGQALQGLVKLVLDVVGPVNGTYFYEYYLLVI